VLFFEKTNFLRLKHSAWALSAAQLLYAREKGIIAKLPDISTRELQKMNKGDMLVKLLAVLQVFWLVAQLIARRVMNLPSMQLEIASLAFSIVSIVTYIVLGASARN
jgi:hypothetical protein